MQSYTPTISQVPSVRRLPQIPPSKSGDLFASWRDEGACKDYTVTELLHPGDFTDDYNSLAILRAQELCGTCPVADLCLADALADRESHGVRGGFYFVMGGLSEESRKMIKKLYNLKSRPIPGTH